MSEFAGLTPAEAAAIAVAKARAAKELRERKPGEASARALERLAAQREGWAEEDGDPADDDDELNEEAEELRSEAKAIRQAQAARKAVAKSGGKVVYLGGIGAVVFKPKS